jgi:hypothetical protein
MPIFLYWSFPLILLFVVSVALKLSNGVIVFTFVLAYMGMLFTFIRSVVVDKNTTRNKNRYRRNPYY